MMKRLLFAAALCCAAAPIRAQDGAADTSRVYELADVETPPRAANVADLRAALQAAYPPALLRAGTGGRVMLSIVVAADGSVRAPRVVATTDSAFNAPSLASVAVLRFAPGARGGTPVATRVEIPIEWQAPPPPRDTAGEGVVAASERVLEGQRVYTMSQVVAEAEALELDAVEEAPRVRNAGEITRAMRRLYPRVARTQQADVEVRMRVDAQGVPGHFRVVRSTDARFDQPSIEALADVRFSPAKVDGRAVPVWVLMPLQWRPLSPAHPSPPPGTFR